MKRLFSIGTLALIAWTSYRLYGVATGSHPVGAQAPRQLLFPGFPIDRSIPVDLALDTHTFDKWTAREKADQARDWLLLTAAADAGLSGPEATDALYDVAPLRHGYLRNTANPEYGEVRSCPLPDKRVLALIPAKGRRPRDRYLAHVADEHRKNLGEIPAELIVFEYALDPSGATLTRRTNVDGATLFTDQSGYFETRVSSLNDLQSWHGKIDDLTYARLDGGSLVLGGRRFPKGEYRGVRVEDVAAIWQADQKLYAQARAFEDKWKKRQDDFNSEWEGKTYHYDFERASLEQQRDQELESLQQEYEAEARQSKIVESCGFSLDPTYDYDALMRFWEKELSPLLKPLVASESIASFSQRDRDLLNLLNRNSLPGLGSRPKEKETDEITQRDLDKVKTGLQQRNSDDLYRLLGKIEKKDKGLADVLDAQIRQSFSLQAARYDGDLKGTEVGMVLFYTDLLAKLWAINYLSDDPKDIADFLPMTKLKLPPVFKGQMARLSNTRLWFGHQNRGFQYADGGNALLFARNATRIYAASANTFQPGVESEANAQSEAFLGWWNNHYEEVAEYEPEYERLNEIMKWSLLVSWLDKADRGQALACLNDVRIDRSNWFPDWVKRQPNCAYTKWASVPFHPKGYKKIDTEALPLLESESYTTFDSREASHILSGGVSLAGKKLFTERVALTRNIEINPLRRRSNLDYASTGDAIKSLENTSFSFERLTTARAAVSITPKPELRLRSLFGEVEGSAPFRREITTGTEELSIGSTIGRVEQGELRIARAGNGFRVGWQARDLETSLDLGRQLSAAANPEELLRTSPAVEEFASLGKDGFAIKLRGSNRWVEAGFEDSKPWCAQSWEHSVADIGDGTRSVHISFPEETAVKTAARSAGTRFVQGEGAKLSSIKTGMDSVPFDERARALVADPAAYRESAKQEFKNALSDTDRLLSEGKAEDALRSLDRLSVTVGESPEIALRRAIAQIESGRTNEAASFFGVQTSRGADTTDLFYQEVQARAARGASELELQNAMRVAQLDDWRALLARAHTPGEVTAAVDAGKVSLQYHIGSMPHGPPISGSAAADGVISDSAAVYVDKAGLHSVDWSLPLDKAIHSALDGGMATVVKLPLEDVAHFRPTRFYAGSGPRPQVLDLVSPNPPISSMPRYYFRPYTPGQDDDDEKKRRRRYVYVIQPRNATPVEL